MIRLAATWVALLAALGIVVAAALLHRGWIGWIAAPVMVALIATNFMHLRRSSALSRIFALAGLFWICVMLVLGSADYLSRDDVLSEADVGSQVAH